MAVGSGDTGHHLPSSMRLQAVQSSAWYGIATSADGQSVGSSRSSDHVRTRDALRRTRCPRSGVSVTDCDRLGGGDSDDWPLPGSLSTVGCCRVEDAATCTTYHCRHYCRRAAVQHSCILREQGTSLLVMIQHADDSSRTHSFKRFIQTTRSISKPKHRIKIEREREREREWEREREREKY